MDNPEFYNITVDGDYAHIFINEATGTFAAESSFGNFGYRWTSIGDRDLKQFLSSLDLEYFAGKAYHDTYVFDHDKTVSDVREFIDEQAESGYASPEELGLAMEELEGLGWTQNAHEFIEQFTATDSLMKIYGGDYYDVIRESLNPQCKGFWQKIWPVFLDRIKS